MSLLLALLPVRCPRCGQVGSAPCSDCIGAATVAPTLDCPPGLDDCRAAFLYDAVGRSFIAPLKYRGHRVLVPWLLQCLDELAAEAEAESKRPFDVVTWVPAVGQNRRRRGFDQGELLARGLARHRGMALQPLLRRTDRTPQTGQSRGGRVAGPTLRANRAVDGHVLVVDDVITTGASMSAAARALRRAGATSVTAIAAAYTPPRSTDVDRRRRQPLKQAPERAVTIGQWR